MLVDRTSDDVFGEAMRYLDTTLGSEGGLGVCKEGEEGWRDRGRERARDIVNEKPICEWRGGRGGGREES